MITSEDVLARLKALRNPEIAAHSERFFQTGPGGYGDGDRFLGIRVPVQRKLAGEFWKMPLDEVLVLLKCPVHEARLVALFILVERYRRGSPEERETIFRHYLDHTAFVNNWDLVDSSAEHIVGAHLGASINPTLESLARSESVWERRIAMISTLHSTRQGAFGPGLHVAEMLVRDEHDLVRNAVGWMLREIGRRAPDTLEDFLQRHYRRMPRVMLRYAIERLPEPRRLAYLRGEVAKSGS
jgi:3-methyladenine DNA glycosylase AlkD